MLGWQSYCTTLYEILTPITGSHQIIIKVEGFILFMMILKRRKRAKNEKNADNASFQTCFTVKK